MTVPARLWCWDRLGLLDGSCTPGTGRIRVGHGRHLAVATVPFPFLYATLQLRYLCTPLPVKL